MDGSRGAKLNSVRVNICTEFSRIHIFFQTGWGFFFWFGVLWFSELPMEADNCPFSETLSTSCQNHSTGLPELMVSPSLKILHISVCLLQKNSDKHCGAQTPVLHKPGYKLQLRSTEFIY